MIKVIIKQGGLNWDGSGRAYPDNPEIDENWDCIWEKDGKYYKIVGSVNHAEWDRVDVKERKLTPKERIELAGGKIQDKYPALVEMSLRVCDERDIPTKLITITYKNETIESYE